MKLSAVILSKGENTTQKAVDSVSFADEVVVILDKSEKNNFHLEGEVKIVKHNLLNNFSQQRNFGASQASGDWLLFLDADETISSELQAEIVSAISGQNSVVSNLKTDSRLLTTHTDAYRLKRRDFFWGRELKFGETKTARDIGFIRLVKKNSGVWKGSIHEQYVTEHATSTLKGFIDHYPHQSISEFLASINEYSTIRSKELRDRNERFSVLKLVFYPVGKFVYTYVLKCGFLDGAAGFVYSFMMSFHSFLSRAKLLNL